METKTPVVLVVLVEVSKLRWSVASIGLDSAFTPLLRSAEGDLATYLGLAFDEQVSFLRHRFCGIVQRGCDRLWPRGQKACQFVFLFDGSFANAEHELTQRVADHFAEWMLSPPVVVFALPEGMKGTESFRRSRLAGGIDRPFEVALDNALPQMFATMAEPSAWELSQRKGTWHPSDHRG